MGFFSSLVKQSPAVSCVLADSHPVIRQMVTVLGFDVVGSTEHWPRLAPAINTAVEYLDAQAASIPGPFDISSAQYTHHPLVHALFPARQEIAQGLGLSRDVKQPLAFLVGGDQKEAFALLGARRKSDAQPGGDAKEFCSHTLRALAANEAGTRQALRNSALASVVTAYGEHLEKLRKNDALTVREWNIENRKDLQVSDADMGKPVVASDQLKPDNLVRGLIAWLQRPAEHFLVTASENAGAGAGSADAVHQIDLLPVLQTRDRRRWIVCIVRFPTDEGVAAIRNEPRQTRYIIV